MNERYIYLLRDFLHEQRVIRSKNVLEFYVLLANMEFRWYEALGLFGLWLFQLVVPHSREEIMFVYVFWILTELILAFFGKRKLVVFGVFRQLVKTHF